MMLSPPESINLNQDNVAAGLSTEPGKEPQSGHIVLFLGQGRPRPRGDGEVVPYRRNRCRSKRQASAAGSKELRLDSCQSSRRLNGTLSSVAFIMSSFNAEICRVRGRHPFALSSACNYFACLQAADQYASVLPRKSVIGSEGHS